MSDIIQCLGKYKADCKYCWHKTGFGKTSHFYCSAFQYCCGDKCCENIDEFYKLWYFWLCVLILILSACIAFYWLRRRYMMSQLFVQTQTDRTRPHARRRRSGRRYRQLTGDSLAPIVIIPESVVTAPPPYLGDDTTCPHPGPPPYTLGSGSSINSTTLPRFPPPYSQIEKIPPPNYSSTDEIVVMTLESNKKHCDKHDKQDKHDKHDDGVS
ncbi:WW domain binding protein VOPP1-like isoform X2 [Ruditapes philippinarum]|uniref:WW domain binding protein VOPP1-like isoform X2 n=1 Tax=Ruditapes philippinarum TaxID=129788 RepID=UPI00295C187B|nr:WW domain binding protein VOPP1-like isoform X2 [Ruditapes philippinarum]